MNTIQRFIAACTVATLLLTSCTEDPAALENGATEEELTDTTTDETEPEDSSTFLSSFGEENDMLLFDSSSYAATLSFERTIYIDSELGSDSNDGFSISTPIQTLDHLNDNIVVKSGDKVLLKGHTDASLEYKGIIEVLDQNGDKPILIASYGDCKARINAQNRLAGIFIANSSNVYTADLKISANGHTDTVPNAYGDYVGTSDTGKYVQKMNYSLQQWSELKNNGAGEVTINLPYVNRYGILIYVFKSATNENIVHYNIDIRDVYYFNSGDAEIPSVRPCSAWSTGDEDTYGYGWGIRAVVDSSVWLSEGSNPDSKLDGWIIDSCNITDVSNSAIKANNKDFYNMLVKGCCLTNTGGPGMQFNSGHNSTVRNCKIIRPGARYTSSGVYDNRRWGRGSGMWCYNCEDLLFEHNYMYRSEGIGDCCGAHIDIGNKNVIIQYCLSVDNCGGFIEILRGNENCSYRYNISIDDGWRNYKTKDETQYNEVWGVDSSGGQGCLVTVEAEPDEPTYNSYIYNNTVLVSKERYDGYNNPWIVSFNSNATGILFANNVMYVPLDDGGTYAVSGSSYTASEGVIESSSCEYKKGVFKDDNITVTSTYLTNNEMTALNHHSTHNLYMTYDEAADSATYPYAENIYYYNKNDGSDPDTSDARYRDLYPKGGEASFPFAGGKQTTLYVAEDAIPTSSSVINQGVTITKLTSDATTHGLQCTAAFGEVVNGLEITEDFFGRAISTPIIGACVAQ